MIHIAICDDKRATTANLEELLQIYAIEEALDIELLYFSTPSAPFNASSTTL